jgi:diguanylate cyclase (GGDEF)-like protein/PAS domain S-box-containing protein
VLCRGLRKRFGSAFLPGRERPDDHAKWWRRPHVLPSAVVAVIGVALSASCWFAVSVREDRLADLDLSARAHSHALSLQNGITEYMDKLAALRALFEASDRAIDRAEFTSFTRSLLHGQTAILALSWIPRIAHSQRDAHELAATAEGLTGYRIKSARPGGGTAPSAVMGEYFPMFYSSREQLDSPVYGLDLNDRGLRQETLERARDDDRLAASPSFTLRAGAGDRTGFFAVLPVFLHGLPTKTMQQRRENLLGFVQGVFQIEVMIETVLRAATTPAGLDLYFFAQDAGLDAAPIYFHASRARSGPVKQQSRAALVAGPHRTSEISIGDRRWTFIAVSVPGGPGTANHVGSWIMLLGGLFVTALLVAYVRASGRHAERLEGANSWLDRTLVALDASSERLVAQNVRFETALSNMSQALLMFDSSGRLMMSNRRYCDIYGLAPQQVTPGCTIRDLLEHRRYQGSFSGDPQGYLVRLQSTLAQGKTFEARAELPDGRIIAILNHPMAGGGWVATHEDITERQRTEAKISYMARHDGLTDLPNRLLFQERLEQALTRTARGEQLAVLCLDIDNFKSVNDTLGHPMGDLLLKQAAARLSECMRETDTAARLGGDEFTIVQVGASQPTDATALAARLIEVISAPYELDGHQVIVGMSIGIAIAPEDGTDPHQLLKNADMALYRAKADGRGVYRFFEPEMDARMQARRALELDLRRAMAAGEFELFYQPLVNVRTQYVRGFEALIRWHHPQRGLIAPLDFIPLAEDTGLIVRLGEWVLRKACEEAARWPFDVSVAVNLSPVQFRSKSLIAAVETALTASGLSPTRLELEITESVLLQESEATLAMLHHFRGLGIRISMDDFGTGYSSLSYLRKFPFDKIKIDASFIRDMADQDESLAIVRAVTAMGASLHMVTTAEGVETREQFDRLRAEGCDEVQGYYFSSPRPAAEVAGLLAKINPKLKAIA